MIATAIETSFTATAWHASIPYVEPRTETYVSQGKAYVSQELASRASYSLAVRLEPGSGRLTATLLGYNCTQVSSFTDNPPV